MRDLIAGERLDLASSAIELLVEGAPVGGRDDPLGLALIALDGDRRRPDGFAPINVATRELRPGAAFRDAATLAVDLAAVPGSVERLMLVIYIVGGIGSSRTLRDFPDLRVTFGDARFMPGAGVRSDRALILVELYRRGSTWRLAANGQGFAGGLTAVASVLGFAIEVPRAPTRQAAADRAPAAEGRLASGSGFAVDARHIVTNAHVVDGAHHITVANEAGTIAGETIFADPRNDLALLRVAGPLVAVARFRDDPPLDLGEEVLVLGFPLQGLLGSGLQASAGNVSALCGIGNDSGILQFTAPIASGNSGGPILDAGGAVVGLVHASLDLDRLREGGTNAENVNFGIKSPLVRTFLATAGVASVTDRAPAARARAAIVREARGYLFRIRCQL